jgi:anti-anti-sigma factor
MRIDEISFEGITMYHDGLSDQYVLTICLEGYLDSINSSKAIEFFNKTISVCKGLKKIELDLSKLTYASSTGIGAFTALLMSCKKGNISLELVNVGSKILDVITLLGFSSFFEIRG